VPVVASALVLLGAAVIASVLPAARAARVDVMEALRSE
jgi:ABC-type antimicrobial peptide transport system permease subunit